MISIYGSKSYVILRKSRNKDGQHSIKIIVKKIIKRTLTILQKSKSFSSKPLKISKEIINMQLP